MNTSPGPRTIRSAFLMAFIAVTGLLYFANTKYKNIFKFDFSTTVEPEKAVKKITLKIEDYQKVRNFLNENDLGFTKDRELDKVELIADSYRYTDVGCLLHL